MAKKIKKVFIVGNDWGHQYTDMFTGSGWEIAEELTKADLIQFTGGFDVTPSLYGQNKHPKTVTSIARDRRERVIFGVARLNNIPMAGICRGGQFLNIMCGGSMFQHITGHGVSHDAFDLWTNQHITVSSTHHQQMIPINNKNKYMVLMTASCSGSIKERCSNLNTMHHVITAFGSKIDYEALYYYDEECLCFQPHPEFPHFPELRERYFSYIDSLC